MLNEETVSCETMFAFSIVMKVLATCSWKVVLSVVILMSVSSSTSSFASVSSNTQFAAGNVASSSALRVVED